MHIGGTLIIPSGKTRPWLLALAAALTGAFLTATVPPAIPDISSRTEVTKAGDTGLRFGMTSLVTSDPGPPALNSPNFIDAAFTIEFVVEPAMSGSGYIGSLLSYSIGPEFNLAVEQHDTSLFVLHRNRSLGFPDILEVNRLNHFVYVASEHGAMLYRNGLYYASLPWNRNPQPWAPGARMTLGNLDWGDYPWQGELSLLRIYERSLAAEDVAHIYRSYLRGQEPPDVSIRLSVPEYGAPELVGPEAKTIVLHIHDWPHRIKLSDTLHPDKQIINAKDLLLNFLATVFLGASLASLMPGRSLVSVAVRVSLAVFLLSASVESLQFFAPARIASVLDVLMNTLGAATGAAVLRGVRP